MTALKVVALSGSLRAKSYNDAALRAAASLAPADLTLPVAEAIVPAALKPAIDQVIQRQPTQQHGGHGLYRR